MTLGTNITLANATRTSNSQRLRTVIGLTLSVCFAAPALAGPQPPPKHIYFGSTPCSGVYRLNVDDLGAFPESIGARLGFGFVTIAECKLYVSGNGGQIRRCNLDGSSPHLLVQVPYLIYGTAIDSAAGKIYWGASGGGGSNLFRIQQANLDGSNVETILPGYSWPPKSIALDVPNGKIYWTQQNEGIRRANLDGSNIELVLPSPAEGAIALDLSAGKMYWSAEFLIRRANLDGSDVQFVAFGHASQIAIDSAGGKLYFSTPGALQWANLDGSQQGDVANGYEANGLAIGPEDADTLCGTPHQCPLNADCDQVEAVFFMNGQSSGGAIWRAEPDGSAFQPIFCWSLACANPLPDPFGCYHGHPARFTIDRQNQHVYFSVSPAAIYRVGFDGSDVEQLVDLYHPSCCPGNCAHTAEIALDIPSGKMYFNVTPGSIVQPGTYRANLDGTQVENVNPATLGGLVIDSDAGYLYGATSSFTIGRASVADTPLQFQMLVTTTTPIQDFGGVDKINGKLWWFENESELIVRVMRCNLDGSNIEQFGSHPVLPAESDFNNPALDFAASRLYTSRSTTVGSVTRSNLQDGGNSFHIACPVNQPGGNAIHEITLLLRNQPGDITGDDIVNIDDLLAVITGWGPCAPPPGSCPADIFPPPDGNGTVNIDDLLFVINNWG